MLALVMGVLSGSGLGLALRLLLFFLGALVVRYLGELAESALLMLPSLDPVYTHAAARSLADLHLQGVAVTGPPGDWLHGALPNLFVEPSRAHWAAVRIVVEPGSPVLARLAAAAIAHTGVLGAGLLVVRAGWRRHRPALVATGVAMQAQVAFSVLGALPSVRELEATGMSFAANALLPWFVLRGTALSDGLGGDWTPLVTPVLVALALLLGYLPTGVPLILRSPARRITVGTAAAVVVSSAACAGIIPPNASAVQPPAAAPVALVQSPVSQPRTIHNDVITDRWFANQTSMPSHVQIAGANYHYQYLVNGHAEVIKGMGLNTQYSQQLSPADRVAQLDRDMAALSALGVNTVLGWDPAEFDAVLLDAAQRYGIGVVMPFDLDPEADYTDPSVRLKLHDEVLAWVARYRTYPALRMWGLGNEVLHKIVHPAWVGPQDPRRESEAEAFSDWLVTTADDIHALDPDHPVTYRSAEDAFVDWVVAAMKRNGGASRPWFVWGTNCYQGYLEDIVDHWTESGMPSALWVSEFAPGGKAVPDRPDGFATMWSYIRRNSDWVLGGAVYAWTRNGPEGVDRTFGLTDDGVPVDGRSLDVLSQLFHAE